MPQLLDVRRGLIGALALTALVAAPSVWSQTTPPPSPEKPSIHAPEGKLPAGWSRLEDGTIIPPSGRRIPPPRFVGETSEERMERIGMKVDPGLDPDPKKVWSRYGKAYTIEKFDRLHAVYDPKDPNMVRPMWTINVAKEIYREDDTHVWVWMEQTYVPTPEELGVNHNPDQSFHYAKLNDEQIGWLSDLKKEMTVVEPASAGKTVSFHESSSGLPDKGSWRNGLAVADMNEDGFPDIIAPPLRGGGNGLPIIFLGDGGSTWTAWTTTVWPRMLNYGSVDAGDLNGDGHMDLAFGVHLSGVVAFLGDGKGKFVDASKGLANDFYTRRAMLVDLDSDGDLDIAALTEGPTLTREANAWTGSPLRGFLNDGKAGEWTYVEIAGRDREVAGDWLTAGDFNGDRKTDIAGASIIYGGNDLVYLGKGKSQWDAFGRGWLPFFSYYGAVTAGQFSSKKQDDLLLSYGRVWPKQVDPKQIEPPVNDMMVGIERISWKGKTPKREVVMQWVGTGPVWGMTDEDFDGDGRRDVMFWRSGPRGFVLLLGDGKGGFRQATLEGIEVRERTLYDLKAADVNGDGRPDLLVMYEGSAADKPGSIHVYLNGKKAAKGAGSAAE